MASVLDLAARVRDAGARTLIRMPRRGLAAIAGRPTSLDGKTLDLEMQVLLRLQGIAGPAVEDVPVTRGRLVVEEQSRLVGGTPPIGAVTDRTIDTDAGPLPLRFYTPRGLSGASPALVFFHGGGWIYGSIASHDALCRTLAEQAQVRVVSVGYRLAPEAPFPAAVDDAWAGWAWVRDHAEALGIDPARIAVGGDSAGGNLAAVVSQRAAQSSETPPAFQLLIYPATDFAEVSRSRTAYGEGFFLTKGFMDTAEQNYLVGDEDRRDPRLSPLHGEVAGVAPAFVVTAGFDPLLDEGAAYADKLTAAGVAVEYLCEESLIHGYANMVSFGRSAPAAVARISAALRRGLS